jgi:hypothetical protein
MKYKEIYGDIFTNAIGYPKAHCISADYALAGGIALSFQENMGMRDKVRAVGTGACPDVIFTNNVFNLVTKKKVHEGPTYEDLQWTLNRMKAMMMEQGLNKIAMPKIGCGIDGLDWTIVKKMICDTFHETHAEVLVVLRPIEQEE